MAAARFFSVVPCFFSGREVSRMPGTLSWSMQWSPLQRSMLSEKTSVRDLADGARLEPRVRLGITDLDVGPDVQVAAVFIGGLTRVDLGHGLLAGRRVDGREKLLADLGDQGVAVGRIDDAVHLAALEVEVEAVDAEAVGPGLGPVHIGVVLALLLGSFIVR